MRVQSRVQIRVLSRPSNSALIINNRQKVLYCYFLFLALKTPILSSRTFWQKGIFFGYAPSVYMCCVECAICGHIENKSHDVHSKFISVLKTKIGLCLLRRYI